MDLFRFQHLSAASSHIGHYVSTRHGGVSSGELSSLNLGLSVGDDPAHVQQNRALLARALGLEAGQLLFPRQTHTNRVALVTPELLQTSEEERAQALADTDGLICQLPGVCISVLSADCVPLLLFDPRQGAIGAVHAGWRGTVARIGAGAVLQMQQAFGSRPEDLLVGIGPSISQEVYQVGPEVVAAFREAFPQPGAILGPEDAEGRAHLNLWEANRRQLQELGVPATQIEVAGLCTYTHHGRFFSARHSALKGGRFGAGIFLKP